MDQTLFPPSLFLTQVAWSSIWISGTSPCVQRPMKNREVLSACYQLFDPFFCYRNQFVKQRARSLKLLGRTRLGWRLFLWKVEEVKYMRDLFYLSSLIMINQYMILQERVQSAKSFIDSMSNAKQLRLPKISNRSSINYRVDDVQEKQGKDPDLKEINNTFEVFNVRGQRLNLDLTKQKKVSKNSRKFIQRQSSSLSRRKLPSKISMVSQHIPKQDSLQNTRDVSIKRTRKHKYFDKFRRQKDPITLKINLYLDFLTLINFSNKAKHKPQTHTTTYKAFVGRGNNSHLVKNCIKSRYWWNIVQSQSEANLVWSQFRQVKFIQNLRSLDITSLQASKSPQKRVQVQVDQEHKFLLKVLNLNDFAYIVNHKNKAQVDLNQFAQPMHLMRIHNHLQSNFHLCNKKALFYNLTKFYEVMGEEPWENIPLTFHVQSIDDPQFYRFKQLFQQKQSKKSKKNKNIWIIKPGENSNRGCGIDVSQSITQISNIICTKRIRPNGKVRTTIIQDYIMPFLYFKRKFDFRCFLLVTSVMGKIKAYWYQEGYIRTTSKQFNIKNLGNRMIHLTNDAVQKKGDDYGKFQTGNKVSYADFQKYLDVYHPGLNFQRQTLPRMQKLARDAIKSTFTLLNFKNRQHTFEVFGLDYMLDSSFKVYLIEVNNNPCLQLSSPLLARIIPSMMQNAFKIALDSLFMPPEVQNWPHLKRATCPERVYQNNKFSLIFDEEVQGEELRTMLGKAQRKDLSFFDIQQEEHQQCDQRD